MKLVKGNELTDKQKNQVTNAFIYRWTIDNDRRDMVWHGREKPTMPLQTDEQWISEHAFFITKSGNLSNRSHYAEPIYMADSQ